MRVPLAAIALLIAAASVSSLAQQPAAPPPAAAPAAPAAGQAPVPAAGQALAPVPAPPQTGPTPQAPAFRSGVDLVSLNVTVTDGTGRYVTDLQESEFMVFENGVKQDMTFFTSRKNPIALAMLLDSSASMENKLPILQTAATSFVRRLQAHRHGLGHRVRRHGVRPTAVHLEPGRPRTRHSDAALRRLHGAAQRDLLSRSRT